LSFSWNDEINGVQRLQTVAKDDVAERWEA
jgi:hypothetical protein